MAPHARGAQGGGARAPGISVATRTLDRLAAVRRYAKDCVRVWQRKRDRSARQRPQDDAQAWAPEEDKIILQKMQCDGPKWKTIVKALPGRLAQTYISGNLLRNMPRRSGERNFPKYRPAGSCRLAQTLTWTHPRTHQLRPGVRLSRRDTSRSRRTRPTRTHGHHATHADLRGGGGEAKPELTLWSTLVVTFRHAPRAYTETPSEEISRNIA